MTDYPFIVMAPRSRLVHVSAKKFSNALSRALSLHPNKFLKTQFAKRMDLVSAQDEAKKLSLRSAHKQFVVLLKSGDFEVENTLSIDPKADIYSVWHKGKKIEGPASPKIKLPVQDEEPPVAKAPKRAELPTKKEMKKSMKDIENASIREMLLPREKKQVKQKESNENQSTIKTKEIMKTKNNKSTGKAVAKKSEKSKVEKGDKTPRGNNMYLTAAEWSKVDALLAKKDMSFSAWSRGLVQAAIK